MIHPPKTKEEAQTVKYGSWAGNPDGRPYNPEQCAYQVVPNTRGGIAEAHQCSRTPGFGPDGLYCKQHAEHIGYYEETGRHLFIAELSKYGAVTLAKVPIARETDKTYTVNREKVEHLLGHAYLSKRVTKGKGVFEDGKAALEFLVDEAEEYIQSLENKLESAKLTFEMLVNLRDECRKA